MALNAYLQLKGQHQGNITGGVIQKGREGSIMVIAAGHDVADLLSTGAGTPVGKLVHKPFSITKEVDRASPLLYTALTSAEIITQWRLDFYMTNAAGVEKNYYRVELVNARITDIKFTMANNQMAGPDKLNPYEEMAFVYQKITWSILDPTTLISTADWPVTL